MGHSLCIEIKINFIPWQAISVKMIKVQELKKIVPHVISNRDHFGSKEQDKGFLNLYK